MSKRVIKDISPKKVLNIKSFKRAAWENTEICKTKLEYAPYMLINDLKNQLTLAERENKKFNQMIA